MNNFFLTIDNFFERAESKFGKHAVWIATGIIFLLISSLLTSIRFETFYHGKGFSKLSLDPFDLNIKNDLRYRILSPLVGYLLFFRGIAFKYLMLAALAVFLGLIYYFQRGRQMRPAEALIITAICAFSTLVFHQLYFPAYTDPVSYLLILLFLFNYKNDYINVILLFLMLFNHENTAFLFPFFFLLMTEKKFRFGNLLKISLKFILALAPYLIFRKLISMNSQVGFTITYYFDPNNIKWTREHILPNLQMGIFHAFKLFWIFPLVAIGINLYEKRYFEILMMIVIFVCVISQFYIAYDISRLTGLAFPLLLISLVRIKTNLGSNSFLKFAFIVIMLNFLVPTWYVGALEPIHLKPWWM